MGWGRRLYFGEKGKSLGQGSADEKEEDRLRISELYSRVPSPQKPEAEDWTPLSVGDQDTHSRILRGDDIKGIKTTLFQYQLVSDLLRLC
jgi:hypothetical protein